MPTFTVTDLGLGRAGGSQRGYVSLAPSYGRGRGGSFITQTVGVPKATPGAVLTPAPSPYPSAPIVPVPSSGGIPPGAQAIINKLRAENAELSARIQKMAQGGATGAQLAERDQRIAKLQGDVAALTRTIQTYNQPPAPGQPPTGLQLAFQALIQRVQQAEAAARNGGGNAQLQAQVAALTRTIQTYNQPPAPGQQPTGLQLAFQQLIRKVQTREAALRAHNLPIPNP